MPTRKIPPTVSLTRLVGTFLLATALIAQVPRPENFSPRVELPTSPTIEYKGNSISETGARSITGVVGQQFTLTGSPSGGIWTIGGTAYSEYTGAGSGPVPVNDSANPVSFYWVDGGPHNVTYTVNGISEHAKLDIAEASGSITAAQVEPVQILGGFLTAPIRFASKVTAPNGVKGKEVWVQVLNSSDAGFHGNGGAQIFKCALAGNPNFPALDHQYPYPFSPGDVPGIAPPAAPPATVDQIRDSQSFSMYLLWQPSGVGVSFPVPLAVIQWSWTGSAQWASGSWNVGQGSAISVLSSGPSAAYPLWVAVATSGDFDCKYVGH